MKKAIERRVIFAVHELIRDFRAAVARGEVSDAEQTGVMADYGAFTLVACYNPNAEGARLDQQQMEEKK